MEVHSLATPLANSAASAGGDSWLMIAAILAIYFGLLVGLFFIAMQIAKAINFSIRWFERKKQIQPDHDVQLTQTPALAERQ